MLQSTLIPLCQYLLGILRLEERELVSIFMDVVKHEILAVFPNPVAVRAHTLAQSHSLTPSLTGEKKIKDNLELLMHS